SVRLAWLCLIASGCIRGATGFQCETDADCARGATAGHCESVHYCSFNDSSCASGNRFGELSGSYANQCGGPSTPVDAMGDTKMLDATPVMPMVTYFNVDNEYVSTTFSYPGDVPAGSNLLIVTVQIANNSCMSGPPNVVSVTWGSQSLARLTSIFGISCNPN